jgi:hypothetical protein
MATIKQIAWLAGLLEGEGCFSWQNTPRIQVASTDFDILVKASVIMRASTSIRNKRKNRVYDLAKRKRMYYLQVNGTKAAEWMMTIYSLMGIRRREKIRWILSNWKQMNGKWGRMERFIPEIKQ